MIDQDRLMSAVGTILETVGSAAAPTLSEKDLARTVVEFANTGIARHLPGTRVLHSNGQTFVMAWDSLDRDLADLRKDLSAIVRGELPGPSVARLRRQAGRVVLVPTFEIERGNVQRKDRVLPLDPQAVVAFVLLMLRDQRTAIGADLKQCRLPVCGKFFLASDQVAGPSARGRRRSRFCCDDHMEQGQTPGAERTRRYRVGLAERQAAAKHK